MIQQVIATGGPALGSEPPTEWRIFPFGQINMRWADGRRETAVFDEQAAARVLEHYQERGHDLSLDYNHAHSVPTVDDRAKRSAGSFELELRSDGLWMTNIQWTADAAEYIRKREYRYLSPWLFVEQGSKRIHELRNVALTPDPATLGIQPLVADSTAQPPAPSEAGRQENHVDPQVVGLTASATPAEVQLRAAALHAFEGTVLEELTASSREDAIGRLKAALAKAEQTDQLTEQVKELRAAAEQRERDSLIKQALADRKLTPAQTAEGAWAKTAPLESLKSFLASAPQIIPDAESKEPAGKTSDGNVDVNAAIRAQAGRR